MEISPATLKRIRQIEMRSRHLVNNSFAGAYHSVFKGRGIAFDSVRPYQPGDDVRDIDWNVTARASEAYVKQFAEERELIVMLMLDTSASCLFGTVNRPKRDLAAEIGAVLALAATSNHDRVGLLSFSDRIENFVAPRKGRNHVLRIIRDLLGAQPAHGGTDLAQALRAVGRMLKQRAIVFVMSDFLLPPEEYARDLLIMNQRHDVVAVVLSDPLERRWPATGIVGLRDAESGTPYWIDTSSPQWRREFRANASRVRQVRDAVLVRAGVDQIDMPVDADYANVLTAFFRQRTRRIRR